MAMMSTLDDSASYAANLPGTANLSPSLSKPSNFYKHVTENSKLQKRGGDCLSACCYNREMMVTRYSKVIT